MSDQTQDQRPDLDEVLTPDACDLREELKSNGASGEIHGAEGAIAYQQALAYPRVLERYEGEDELVDAERMEADARQWIDSEVEENPEAFDPQFTPEAFEAIPDDLKQNGRFMSILKKRYEGEKNVGTEELTSEVIEEIADEADPRVDVQPDGPEEKCYLGQETFQPERYRSQEGGREKGHFHAFNGQVFPVCNSCRKDYAEGFHARTAEQGIGDNGEGIWPRWETRKDATERAERQQYAIEQAEQESRLDDAFGQLSAEERVRETMKGLK